MLYALLAKGLEFLWRIQVKIEIKTVINMMRSEPNQCRCHGSRAQVKAAAPSSLAILSTWITEPLDFLKWLRVVMITSPPMLGIKSYTSSNASTLSSINNHLFG